MKKCLPNYFGNHFAVEGKHKQNFPVTARVGGVSRPGGGGAPDRWPGVKSLCAVCGTQGKHFRPGTRPGGFGYPAGRVGDRGDREIVYVPNVYVPFPAPREGLCEIHPLFGYGCVRPKLPSIAKILEFPGRGCFYCNIHRKSEEKGRHPVEIGLRNGILFFLC